MVASELMHEELQKMFKDINESTEQPLILKSDVDFLEPYLPLIENVSDQIPMNIPMNIPPPFTGFDSSEIFKTQK